MNRHLFFIRIPKLLFIQISYVFLICNILAAHVPEYSLLFIAIRDSWIVTFLFLLARSKKNKINLVILGFMAFCGIFGSIAFVEYGISSSTSIVFIYGFRDICLISFIVFVLKNQNITEVVSRRSVDIFVVIVLLAYLLQIIFQIIGLDYITESIYKFKLYYASKGVEINLDGGLLGMRPGAPLYSPGLIATLLSFYILIKKLNFLKQLFIIMASFITLSKVVVLVVVYKIFKKIYILVTIGLFVFMFGLVAIAENIKENYPNTIYSYHAHSITEHLGFYHYFNEKDNTLLPDLLGSSSIAGALILGEDSSNSPESLLVSKFKDYNWLSLFFLTFIFYFLITLKGNNKFYFVVFLLLQLFTGMSNQPVCYVALYLIGLKKK